MALLYYWRRENYEIDILGVDPAAGLELEQSSRTFAAAAPGERIWALTRRQDGAYVLAAQLQVGRVVEVGPDAQYGRYRIVPQPGTTRLYDVQRGPSVEDLIRSLSVRADAGVLGRSFQGASAVRRLTTEDDVRLQALSEHLPLLENLFGESVEDHLPRWWAGLLLNAGEALAGNTIFESPVRRRRYRVEAVEPDRIRVGRLDANEPVVLTRQRADLAVRRILAAGGRVQRGSEFYRVAKEAAFVEFHPAFSWDESRNWIVFRPELETEAAITTPSEGVQERSRGANALWSIPLTDLRKCAMTRTTSNSSAQERSRRIYERSEAVRVYVLRRAGGVCEGCGNLGPFLTPEGHRYLEPHHIRRRADNGPDHPRWVIGLCPSCHRRVHYGADGAAYNSELAERAGTLEAD